MKKSLNAWTVEKSTDMRTTFAQVRAAGFDGIELNIDAEGRSAHSLFLTTSVKELNEIKAISEFEGLPVVSICSSLWKGMTEDYPDCERLLTKQLECAAALGARGILTVPGGINDRITLKGAYEGSVGFMKKMVPVIESSGLVCGVENVWNGFFTSPFDMVRFIDEVGSEKVGAYYDLGNAIAFSCSEHWVEVLGSHIKFVHIKDYKRNSTVNSGGAWVNIGEGSANWKLIMAQLRKTGFDGYVTGEVFKSDNAMSYTDYYSNVACNIAKVIEFTE